jgi:hypothetical protein
VIDTAGPTRFGMRVRGCPASRRSVRFAGLALGGLLLAAACTDGGGPTALPSGPPVASPTSAAPRTTTATPAPTPTTTTGGARSPIRWFGPAAAGAQRPVQAAAKAYWSMVVRLAEKPDPDDPQLAALTVSPQRDTLVKVFGANATGGVSQRGVIDATVSVRSVTDSSAIAMTCLDQTAVKVYERNGRARPGTGGIDAFTLTLRLQSGSWKVQRAVTVNRSCTIPR